MCERERERETLRKERKGHSDNEAHTLKKKEKELENKRWKRLKCNAQFFRDGTPAILVLVKMEQKDFRRKKILKERSFTLGPRISRATSHNQHISCVC